ncbi:MAG: hypothetical protein P0S93_02105 [Candidatus Neptunochlamydia sp.]|nr:hypothetical protein [Candidatus Neptunochlamydia sp.]
MTGMITNVICKSFAAGARLSYYIFVIAAAGKMAELGFRAVSWITNPEEDNIFGSIVAIATNWYGANTSTEKLLKQIVTLTLLAAVIRDAAYYIEGSPPKIYNISLVFTPIRVPDTSIPKSVESVWKNFDAKALFVNS